VTIAADHPVQYGYALHQVQRGSRLTERERRILDLASHGCTNAVIATRMELTEDRVKIHMRAICIRLDAHDRAHAVRRGFRLGYLTDDDTARREAAGRLRAAAALLPYAEGLEALADRMDANPNVEPWRAAAARALLTPTTTP
jgi:DNA-binding CsgD family transcriptional regulator